MNQSQAQIFVTEYAKNTATDMLQAIRQIGRRAGRITKIALSVSMPHQIGFILALAWPHMHWFGVSQALESITMILLAIAVPIATDLLILNCVETIGAAAAARGSKIRAFCIILVPVAASGTVNFLAPAPLLIKILAAFIVTMIPMGESLRFIRPDFSKIERMEIEVAAQVTQPVVEPVATSRPGRKISDQEKAARKRAGYDKMSPADKRAWTKAYKPRVPRIDATPVELIEALEDVAPVSPAMSGR
jgi:hypothetical protein